MHRRRDPRFRRCAVGDGEFGRAGVLGVLMFDVVIRQGTVVTAGSLGVADVGVEGGLIAEIGRGLKGRRVLDAQGMYVFPGGVDVHVHFTPNRRLGPGDEVQIDDFCTGSRAAIAGGITTIGNMTYQLPGDTLRAALSRDLAVARADAAVDYILHPVLTNPSPDAVGEIPGLAAEGHTSLKIFLLRDDFDPNVDGFLDAIRAAARHRMVTLLHCEDGPLIRQATKELLATGCGTVRYYPDSRPDYTERVATERAIAMASATGAIIYVVHLSSATALESCRRARADGVLVYVETRPLYLHLTRERFEAPDAGKYVGNPPLRTASDVTAIWRGLAHGDIQCVCSDHVGWTLQQKIDPTLDITTVRPGVADLETLMPMLFSEGVLTGRISLHRFVELTSTSAARLFGMFPQKGTIMVGSDADLVVWDPQALRTVDGSRAHSKTGYSVYDGWEVRGWPIFTMSRGDVVLDHNDVIADRGRVVGCAGDPRRRCNVLVLGRPAPRDAAGVGSRLRCMALAVASPAPIQTRPGEGSSR